MTQLLLSLWFCCVHPAWAQEQATVEVTRLSGTVEVLLRGQDEYAAAQEGMTLEAGDKIKTGPSSCAELSFNENNTNIAKIDANASLEVVLKDDEKMELTQGDVFTSISELPSGSAFEIRTPTAVTGARGTDWTTKVDSEGTIVEAFDSNPYVRHKEQDGTFSKQETVILAGHTTTVRPFQRPMPLRRLSEYDRNRGAALRAGIREHAAEAFLKRRERPQFRREDFIEHAGQKRAGHSPGRFFEQEHPRHPDSGHLRSSVLVSGPQDESRPTPQAQRAKQESFSPQRINDRPQASRERKQDVREGRPAAVSSERPQPRHKPQELKKTGIDRPRRIGPPGGGPPRRH